MSSSSLSFLVNAQFNCIQNACLVNFRKFVAPPKCRRWAQSTRTLGSLIFFFFQSSTTWSLMDLFHCERRNSIRRVFCRFLHQTKAHLLKHKHYRCIHIIQLFSIESECIELKCHIYIVIIFIRFERFTSFFKRTIKCGTHFDDILTNSNTNDDEICVCIDGVAIYWFKYIWFIDTRSMIHILKNFVSYQQKSNRT